MQSSSLIFVVVVAIWAAYLVQYWVRRRDHLATVRSVDRFSAAMRVLDSHRLSQTEEPARSYAVSPARAARPEVVVKRTVTVPEAPVPEPELEDEGSGRLAVVSAVVDAPRQVRGLAFLGHLVLLPIAFLFSAFGSLPWLVTGLLLVGLLGSFGWLRQDVKAAEARRREEHLARRRSREAAAPVRRPAPRRAPVHAETTTEVVVDEPERAVAEAAVPQTVATDAPFDVSAPVEAAPAEPADVEAPAAVVDDREGTWEPVPVPRPTYTMKARAGARPVVEDAPAEDTPQVLDAIDDDVVAPQRAVGS
ncbi:hypothetical protein [Janibacter sp. UYMM211]|uniref:hypothetical protein n=1 Tax=Janibacter sp. UYMM211 TaxID=3156342 RepID=UPI00339496E1